MSEAWSNRIQNFICFEGVRPPWGLQSCSVLLEPKPEAVTAFQKAFKCTLLRHAERLCEFCTQTKAFYMFLHVSTFFYRQRARVEQTVLRTNSKPQLSIVQKSTKEIMKFKEKFKELIFSTMNCNRGEIENVFFFFASWARRGFFFVRLWGARASLRWQGHDAEPEKTGVEANVETCRRASCRFRSAVLPGGHGSCNTRTSRGSEEICTNFGHRLLCNINVYYMTKSTSKGNEQCVMMPSK